MSSGDEQSNDTTSERERGALEGLSPEAAVVFELLSLQPRPTAARVGARTRGVRAAVEELVRASLAVRIGGRLAAADVARTIGAEVGPRDIAIDELAWPSSLAEALLALPRVIAAIVSDADPRAWPIVSARFGIEGERRACATSSSPSTCRIRGFRTSRKGPCLHSMQGSVAPKEPLWPRAIHVSDNSPKRVARQLAARRDVGRDHARANSRAAHPERQSVWPLPLRA